MLFAFATTWTVCGRAATGGPPLRARLQAVESGEAATNLIFVVGLRKGLVHVEDLLLNRHWRSAVDLL